MPDDTSTLVKSLGKTDPPKTTATQDVLSDPLLAPTLRQRHSPLDKTSELEPGTYGSGSVTTTVSRYGNTLDGGSGTKSFLHQKKAHPELSDKELWTLALQYDLNPGGERTELTGSDPDHYDEGKKVAYVVGNKDYEGDTEDLPGAGKDAASMASHYEGKGYRTFHAENLHAQQMSTGIQALEKLEDGDAGVLYYAGHGSSRGLWGTDMELLKNSVISSTTSSVLGKGAKLDVVIDACKSGGLQESVEDEFGFDRESKDLPHATAKESAAKGYGWSASDSFVDAHNTMVMDGEEMTGGWHMSHKEGTTIDDR